ncbi:MAG: DUF3375 domain-containing protein [Pirellulales bacterium]
MTRELSQRLTTLRRNHATWLLLASRNGPLILASLKSLIEAQPSGIDFEEAVVRLSSSFADYGNDPEFELGDDYSLSARRELKQWVKRGLVVEREGLLFPTDALQRALHFLDSLEDQAMTSTASRLATVQRAIENLDTQLSANQSSREQFIKARIDLLAKELADVRAGKFEVLDGSHAEEGIREVYQLAISLQADFRRVEDSYREADRALRQRIISEKHNRGEIVDELLGGHQALVQTPEGQVFEAFHQQLIKSAELEQMKIRLRSILSNTNTDRALQRKQRADLRQLVSRLVQDSERVIQARARSERDVRGFLKSGLANEQMRVGALLQDIFQVALEVDWQSQNLRRSPSPLPPLPVAIPNLPLIERLLLKQISQDGGVDLDLTVSVADPTKMDDEFWLAYNALDRAQLFVSTLATLQTLNRPLTLGELVKAIPPTHDLEILAYWLTMARQAGVQLEDWEEAIDLFDDSNGVCTRFHVPGLHLSYAPAAELDSGNLE